PIRWLWYWPRPKAAQIGFQAWKRRRDSHRSGARRKVLSLWLIILDDPGEPSSSERTQRPCAAVPPARKPVRAPGAACAGRGFDEIRKRPRGGAGRLPPPHDDERSGAVGDGFADRC